MGIKLDFYKVNQSRVEMPKSNGHKNMENVATENRTISKINVKK